MLLFSFSCTYVHVVKFYFSDFFPHWDCAQLKEDGSLDWDALKLAVKSKTKCALIQRSCGYSWRHSLSVTEIGRAIDIIKVNLRSSTR